MTYKEHFLTIVAEEAVEVAQRATKALRFGLHEKQPGQDLDNAERLMREVDDLLGALQLIAGLREPSLSTQWKKQTRIMDYLDVSREQGTLSE